MNSKKLFGSRMNSWFKSLSASIAKHRVGILTTIIIHLLVIASFLVFKIEDRTEEYASTIEMEFEEPKAQEELLVEEKPEQLLPTDVTVPSREMEAIKNFAVDATQKELNAGLSDEKNTDADNLYSEANRIREQMQENKERYEQAMKEADIAIPNTPEKNIPEEKKNMYKGPTVISYNLAGRKAYRLPVPSYKCEMGGQVVVNIEVLSDGSVSNATIDWANSVNDECINNAAIMAALASRFSSTQQSTGKEKGSITYLFVAQ